MSLTQQAGSIPSPTPEERQSHSPEAITKPGLKLPPILENILLERKKREWVSWVNTEFVKCKNARQPFERQWYLNIAFYQGRQYLTPINVPGHGFRLTTPKAPPWRVRMVVNKVRTAVRTECAKLTMNRPIPTVIPVSTEDEDYSAARMCERILKTEFHTMNFDKQFKSFVWWGSVTGNSFLKSWWDPTYFDEGVQPPALPNPMGPQFPPLPNPVYGKICYERITPFHIYVPDLLAEDLEDQPYVIHAMTKSKLWVDKAFGMNSSPDARSTNTIMEAAVLTPQTTNQHMDSVMVKEVWIKPNAHEDFPEGGVLTVVNDKIVQHQEKWPYKFNDFPFYKFDGMPTGGFYTESVITDLIPVQKEYNRTKSQMIEIKNLMGKPKIMAPKGSVNARQITSEPGQVIYYTPGFEKPDILPPVPPSPGMSEELDRLTSDFDDISGQHEITRGNTPSQVTSGTAISFLQEQDDSKLSYQVASIERCIQNLGTHYLKFASEYWSDDRLIRIVGTDGSFEAVHWKNNMLKGNTDVRVQSGSGLPFSKAARSAMLTEFMQNGWVAPETGMEMLEMNGYEKIIEDFLVDKRAAERENLRLADAPPEVMQTLMSPPTMPGPNGEPGQPILMDDPRDPNGPQIPMDPMTGQPWTPQPPLPVNSWDNHQAHIHYHNQYRKTQQFEMLDDSIKQAFELHVQGHQMAMSLPILGQGGIPLENSPDDMAAEEEEGEPIEEGGSAAPPM